MITTDPLVERPASAASAAVLRLEQVSKAFGPVAALHPLTLEIGQGEFFSLLGSSGSGKTTTLRLIAGFERPDTGRIVLAGKDVTEAPPYDRDVNTVFQDYALFPHMTVWDNIAYGLRARRVARADIARRVADALELVRLAGFDRRRPAQLSGGQRQRVALARAIVNLPTLLLLDEPLGALDLKLRREMQVELKRIQQEVGITFVYVTHDQDEALSMSDRLAVMNSGRLLQIGTPREIYDHPANTFVATFVGSANLVPRLHGTPDGAHIRLELPGFERLVVGAPVGWQPDQAITLAVRPERLRLLGPGEALPPALSYGSGEVCEITFTGGSLRYTVRVGARDWTVIEPNARSSSGARPGDLVRIAWDIADGIALLD